MTVEALPAPVRETTRRTPARRAVKRGLDVALALLLLVLLAPLMLLLAALVAVSGPGPVIYRQTRIGRDDRAFTIRKFRTMRPGADREVAALRALNEADGPLFKIRDDPRVTRVGRWLRRLSLDELPQLFCVLGGSMSLVGPRPLLPEEAARCDEEVRRRHRVRPGLTGPAQVGGRSDLDWAEAVRLDLAYVDDWSLRADLAILLRTVPAVLRGRGAY